MSLNYIFLIVVISSNFILLILSSEIPPELKKLSMLSKSFYECKLTTNLNLFLSLTQLIASEKYVVSISENEPPKILIFSKLAIASNNVSFAFIFIRHNMIVPSTSFPFQLFPKVILHDGKWTFETIFVFCIRIKQ